jgi:O-antigen/teichoic acid export membrane protein
MTYTRKIAHNSIIQIAGKIITTFLGLVAIAMMTRYLGTEKFGWYITVISFLQFIGILIDFGLIPVTAQMLSEPKFNKEKLFQNLLGFRFVTAIIFLSLAPLIAMFFPYPREVKIAISFVTISFLSISMSQIWVGFYQTKLKMHIQTIAEVISRIVLVGGFLYVIKTGGDFLPIMWIVTISSVVYMIIMWLWGMKFTKISFGFDWNMWKAIMTKMWPIAVSIIFNVVYLKGDIIILSLFKSQTEVGLYGAAYRVIDILAQTAMLLMGIILPLLAYTWSRNLKKQFLKRYQQAFDAMMLFAVPVTIGTIMLADKIMKLVAGDEFITSGKPLQILAIAVFGLYLGAVFGHTAVAINKQKQTMWIYISNAIITLIGYFIFIPKFGLYGAAWMTVFSELYAGLLLFITIRHYTKEKLQYKTFSKILFASIIMGLTIYLLNQLHVLFLVFIGIITYGLALILVRGISRETIKEILTLKKRG